MGSAQDSKHVCIIGAGVVGLLAIRHVNQSKGFVGTVFEQMDRVGGLWHYVENTRTDVNQLPVHSAMYAGLSANISKELMQFDDFECPDYENGVSYLSHSGMQKYLSDYAEKFNLTESIQFNTRVLSVKPKKTPSSYGNSSTSDTKWEVEVYNHKTNSVEEHTFDAVVVGNGKFVDPIIPEIDGINEFEGQLLHTKVYRRAKPFTGQHVVIMGFGPSALDIGNEIAESAESVTICHRTPFELPSSVMKIIKRIIVRVKKNSVVFENGEEIPCDSLLYATGYNLSYPFLHSDCGISVEEGKYVTPLYKNLMSANYPTLCFPNLPSFASDWMVAEIQIQYFVRYLQGMVILPTEGERLRELAVQEDEWNWQKIPVRHRMKMGMVGERVYPYLENLAKEGGFTEVIRNLPLKRKCWFVLLGRLFGQASEIFKKDIVRWIDSDTITIFCVSGPEPSEAPEELLTLRLDEETGEINITSSLGEIKNPPLFNF